MAAWQLIYDAIVAPSGGDYTTIGAAVADGNKRILVTEGTYLESGPIDLPEGADIIGVGTKLVTVDFGGSGDGFRASPSGISTASHYDGGGTIAVTADSVVVTGTGTTFLTATTPVQVGDQLVVDGDPYTVDSVDSDTQLTLQRPYASPSRTGLSEPSYFILPMHAGARIRDLTIVNFDPSSGYAVDFLQVMHGHVDGVRLQDSISTNGQAQRFELCLDTVIESCQFIDCGASSMRIHDGWRTRVTNCYVTGCHNSQIFLKPRTLSPPRPSAYHVIEGCLLEGGARSSSNGLHANRDMVGLSITGNTVLNCDNVGIVVSGTSNAGSDELESICEGNVVRNCGTGIRAQTGALVQGNSVTDCAQGLHVFGGGQGAVFKGNLVERCTRGIDVDPSSPDYVIVGNTIRDCDSALIIGTYGGICHSNIATGCADDNTAGPVDLNQQTLSADKDLFLSSPSIQQLDPDGVGRVVTLPPFVKGLPFTISNTGSAENLDVRDTLGNQVALLTPGLSASVLSDGSSWISY